MLLNWFQCWGRSQYTHGCSRVSSRIYCFLCLIASVLMIELLSNLLLLLFFKQNQIWCYLACSLVAWYLIAQNQTKNERWSDGSLYRVWWFIYVTCTNNYSLFRMHSNLSKGFGTIGPKDFFPLLDFAYMPNNSLSSK